MLFIFLISPLFPWDLIFGTLATLISCLIVSFMKRLAIACVFPVVINAFVVGAELFFITQASFWYSTLLVAVGELVVIVVGYILFMFLKKKPRFYDLIKAKRNIDFKF